MSIADYYPVGMCDCDRIVLDGDCNENCPLLKSEEKIRFEDECYDYEEYLIMMNKRNMSAIKHLEI
jgi:hypothetical protein